MQKWLTEDGKEVTDTMVFTRVRQLQLSMELKRQLAALDSKATVMIRWELPYVIGKASFASVMVPLGSVRDIVVKELFKEMEQ